MTNIIDAAHEEYKAKKALKDEMFEQYARKMKDLGLEDFQKIKKYLKAYCGSLDFHLERDLIFAHLGFENIASSIANKQEFVVISGLNPSSPLHFGHKVLFDILAYLQTLGAFVYIPITNDESYVDNKVSSIADSRRIAYEEIIPSILALGLSRERTRFYVLSDYPEIYNFAMHLSRNVDMKYLKAVFGEDSLDNSGKIFYRAAVQLAQILLPQLSEFGGKKETLIPVGIDQHPYLLLSRDIAKKTKFTLPSELVFKFQPSLKNPVEKMSGSKPDTAIYLNDTEDLIKAKIAKAYTGSVSLLSVHKELGAVPEVCPVFNLLNYHCADNNLVNDTYEKYRTGKISGGELKALVTDFVVATVKDHQKKRESVGDFKNLLINTPIKSIL